MRVLSFYVSGLLLLGLFASCKKNVTLKPLTIAPLTLHQQNGTDCDKADTFARVDCARLQLQWPRVQDGSAVLQQSVDRWATAYFIGVLASTPDAVPANTVAAAAKSFFESHQREEKSVMTGGWTGESEYQVLLNDGQYLTLEISSYIYQGGTHGTPSAVVATFEVATGRQLKWADLVTDQTALKSVAEQTFRQTRVDLFEPADTSLRYTFGPDNPFTLPQQYGLVAEGIYCHYVHYELGPYAMGSTQMIIPFEALGTLAKIAPPPNAPKPLNPIVLPDYSPAAVPAPQTEPAPKPVTTKPAAQTNGSTKKTSPKKAPKVAAPAAPAIVLKQNGGISMDGKKIADLEDLRKQLQDRLLTYTVIPEKIGFKTVGQTGMGMRAEIKTIISESVAGAKWIRKKAAIQALNTAVGKKLSLSTKLEPGIYQTNGGFAYLSAQPVMMDGRSIDYNRTDYAQDLKAPWFADNAIGLLHLEKGTWKVLAYTIGVRKPPVDVWRKKYGAPKALFK